MAVRAFMKRWLMRRVIAICLRKNAPSEWVTSGEEGRKLDLYAIYLIDGAGEARFVVNDMTSSTLEGKWSLDGKEFTEPRTLPSAELSDYTLYIQHYYGGWTFYSLGMPSFLWKWATQYPYFRVKLDRHIQAEFNKRELTRHDRMKVLEFIQAKTIKDRDFKTGSTQLLTEFYSARWVHRHDKTELMNYYQLLLDALVETGDIASTDTGYVLKPKALNSISNFALEEQRHKESQAIQSGIFWLTVVLMLIGAAQGVAAVWEAFFKPG